MVGEIRDASLFSIAVTYAALRFTQRDALARRNHREVETPGFRAAAARPLPGSAPRGSCSAFSVSVSWGCQHFSPPALLLRCTDTKRETPGTVIKDALGDFAAGGGSFRAGRGARSHRRVQALIHFVQMATDRSRWRPSGEPSDLALISDLVNNLAGGTAGGGRVPVRRHRGRW